MGMSMGMGISMYQSLKLSQDFYEHSGQLELLSLHRIKNRIGSMEVSDKARIKLIEELVRENQDYVTQTGNNWRCITPDGLDCAVGRLNTCFYEQIDLGVSTIDNPQVKSAVKKALSIKAEQQTGLVRRWFSDRYDELIYDTSGTIPYPIVMAMRSRFSQWAIGNLSSFDEPIEDLIEEVAISSGIDSQKYEDSEAVWNALKRIKRK